MRDALRAELLKARSGYAMLGVFSFAVLIPFFAYSFAAETLDRLTGMTPTNAMLTIAAVCPISAQFLGSYLVTREHYYHSLPRAVLLTGAARLFKTKNTAAAVAGLAIGLVGCTTWTAYTWLVVSARDQVFDLDAHSWRILAGVLLASTLAGPLGASWGWILRDYYLTLIPVLAVPLVMELPLAITWPSLGRFLPLGTFAGISAVPLPGLLSAGMSAAIAASWGCVVSVVARRKVLDREP